MNTKYLSVMAFSCALFAMACGEETATNEVEDAATASAISISASPAADLGALAAAGNFRVDSWNRDAATAAKSLSSTQVRAQLDKCGGRPMSRSDLAQSLRALGLVGRVDAIAATVDAAYVIRQGTADYAIVATKGARIMMFSLSPKTSTGTLQKAKTFSTALVRIAAGSCG